MPKPFKVLELLSSAEVAELETFVRERERTVDEVWAWLTAPRTQASGEVENYNISRGAAANWLQDYKERLVVERMTAGGSMARALMDAAKAGGGLAVHDAAIVQVGQSLFERAMAGDIQTDELNKISLALQRLSLAKSRIEDVRDQFEARQKLAIEEASKVVQAGGDGKSVVDKVREILGIGGGKGAAA